MRTFKNPVSYFVDNSSKITSFKPTYLLIYDKTVDPNICNRLIVIYPFRWTVLCFNNELYVLDTNSPFRCPTGMHPGLKLFQSNNVKETCLSIGREDVIQHFSDVWPQRIEYDLNGIEKFTITDAINMLLGSGMVFLPEMSENNKHNLLGFPRAVRDRFFEERVLRETRFVPTGISKHLISNKSRRKLRSFVNKISM